MMIPYDPNKSLVSFIRAFYHYSIEMAIYRCQYESTRLKIALSTQQSLPLLLVVDLENFFLTFSLSKGYIPITMSSLRAIKWHKIQIT